MFTGSIWILVIDYQFKERLTSAVFIFLKLSPKTIRIGIIDKTPAAIPTDSESYDWNPSTWTMQLVRLSFGHPIKARVADAPANRIKMEQSIGYQCGNDQW